MYCCSSKRSFSRRLMFVFQGQSPRTGRMLLLPSLLLLTLLTRMAHSSFWTTGNAGSSRMGGRSPSRALAFMGSKRKISGLSLPGNGTASFLTTGSSVLHIHNSNVTLLSLDSNTLPLQARGGLNTNSTGSGGVVGLSSGTAATSSGGRGLGGARGQGLAGQGGGALDQLAGEALQTIGGALFEATCFYIASRIIMGVRNLCGRTFVKPTGVKFSDVIGVDEAKQEVQELVEYLKEPMRYKKLGAKIPRGILLVGPPGVGKTMLARAIAGEASCPFYYASGSDFANPYWGMGVQKIKKLFHQARRSKRSIIFIDELDSLARARKSSLSGGSAEMDAENTLNQLLTEMDGFQTQDNVIVLASTNRADVLDRAAMRPGRFDRKVFMDVPDVQGREEHFKRLLKKFTLAKPVEELAPLMARMSPGYSGADIENVVNEAALRAAKHNRSSVTEDDLSWATERTGFGVERRGKMTPAELRRTAVHEAGHALIAYFIPDVQAPIKISIINRGKVGGYNLMGESNHTYHTEARLRDEICVFLGGRVAEEMVLGEASSGAYDDLRKASALSRGMVENLGYGKRTGLLSYGAGGQGVGEVSQAALRLLEEEAQSILGSEYTRAKTLVQKHRKELEALVELLLKNEVVHEHELEAVLGPRVADVGVVGIDGEGGVGYGFGGWRL